MREPRGHQELAYAVGDRGAALRDAHDLDALIARAGDARYVLLGEASHGTSEYYTWRAEITKRLIEEKGFSFVAVEGDWPACWEVNKWIRAPPGEGPTAEQALMGFSRWPTWMWANREVANLIEWMRERNWDSPPGQQVGFYGLDMYSLWESLEEVLRYLDEHEPEAVAAAQRAFACFEPFGRDEQAYAAATMRWVPETCEREVVNLLAQMRQPRAEQGRHASRDEIFNAEQNALVARSAEHYYRIMVHGGPESWNVRDRHMHETLERLMAHHGPRAKAIVWEHNTHVGDARATDMAGAGMVNLGQLVREAHPRDDVTIVGFGSYEGGVVAGSHWGAPMERMRVPPAREGSWEDVFHRAGGDRWLLSDHVRMVEQAQEWRGHRAIGVVYDPEREAWGNYVPTVLPARYDAFLFFDKTNALKPLHAPVDWREVPETYPMGE